MRYSCTPTNEKVARAWWKTISGTDSIRDAGQIRAHKTESGDSQMIVEWDGELICCARGDGKASHELPNESCGWQITTVQVDTGTSRLQITSATGATTMIDCPTHLVDDLIWFDPIDEVPLRLIRALSELEALTYRDDWSDELAALLKNHSELVEESASAMELASQSVQSGRPMSEADVQRLLASDSALVDALGSLREIRMRGSLINHTLTIGAHNLRALIGDHHGNVADQILTVVTDMKRQNEHDLVILEHAIGLLEATQSRATQLFERSRYIVAAARETTAAIQGALFAAVGIALALIQVIDLPHFQMPNVIDREWALVVFSAGALTFVLGIVFSHRSIGDRRVFWGAIVAGASFPLILAAARLGI